MNIKPEDLPVFPPHAAELMLLFSIDHSDGCAEDLYWRFKMNDDGQAVFYFFPNVNDAFYKATSDAETVREEDMPLLRQCYDDCNTADPIYGNIYFPILFAARKRNLRPLQRVIEGMRSPELAALFDGLHDEKGMWR